MGSSPRCSRCRATRRSSTRSGRDQAPPSQDLIGQRHDHLGESLWRREPVAPVLAARGLDARRFEFLFIWWFRRVYGNVAALGARDFRFGHGWAVGAWLVPILNLFRPFQIAQDSWQASDPELHAEVGAGWRSGSRSAVVGGWWALFIISGVIDRIAAAQPTETADDLISADRMLMASNVVDVVAAALAIAFVLRLTKRQRARAMRIAASS
jgi:Domain of unknown function (DUF4328)